MRVGVLGAGESGVGAAILATTLNHEVFVSDAGTIPETRRAELEKYQVPFEEGGHSIERLKHLDCIVKSPGIPGTADVIRSLRAAGVRMISELEYAFRHCPGKVIAITGSNGKTTTTMLVHHLLVAAGFDAALCGNIGVSFARAVAGAEHDWYVVEVSSYQLEDVEAFQPEIALLLNITPDHLDRYGGDVYAYARTKWRIAAQMQPEHLLIYHEMHVSSYDLLDRYPVEAELCPLSFPFVVHSEDLPDSLRAPHDMMNLAFAAKAVARVGVTGNQISEALRSFRKPAHRMEVIASNDGVSYINDSKATNTDAVFYALQSVRGPVIWIAGGEDKGNDYTALKAEVQRCVKVLICLGIDNRNLIEAFSSEVDEIMETTSMFEAVRVAASNAIPGDTVLLSPACASFDLFENYKDRGEQFRQAVLRLTVSEEKE